MAEPVAIIVTTGVLAGVVANALTTALAKGYQSARKLASKKTELRETLASYQPLNSILQRVSTKIGRRFETGQEDLTERMRWFFASPDVEGILRDVYSAQMIGGEAPSELSDLFVQSFCRHVGLEGESWRSFATDLFQDLLSASEAALKAAADANSLGAHEALSSRRYQLLREEVEGIHTRLELLLMQQNSVAEAARAFEQSLREQSVLRFGFITPPHLDSQKRVPIDDIYVLPAFISDSKGEREAIDLPGLCFQLHRTVVLGNPGAGKSTLTLKLCHEVAKNYEDRLIGNRRLTPLLVVLREFGVWYAENESSIVRFLEERCALQVPVVEGGFDYLLANGRLMVVFDGLDELLDTTMRRLIRDEVESFCNLYPSVPVLVTSRFVGYEQAPLDPSRFETIEIADFGRKQVEQYATKWFSSVVVDLDPAQREEKVRSFILESEIASDLRSNPLMLGLMCNLFRGEGYIPRNRPDIYEKCATLLFEKWDPMRGIRVILPFEAHVGPAIKHLALWIYENPSLQEGVAENKLVTEAASYLHQRRFEDVDEATHAAKEFIGYCRGRAWVFTDTGTTAEGDRLYQFTHRTFLEYFAAAHLVRTNATPALLTEVLLPKIRAREWDVVAQLAVQIQSKSIDGAADEILRLLMDQVAPDVTSGEDLALLSFASRCLEFSVPKPLTVREVVGRSIDHILKEAGQSPDDDFSAARELPDAIMTVGSDNQAIVARALVERVQSACAKDPRADEAVLATELTASLDMFGHGRKNDISSEVRAKLRDEYLAVAPHSAVVAHRCLWEGAATVKDVVDWFGVEHLFRMTRHRVCKGTRTFPIATTVVNSVWLQLEDDEEWKTVSTITRDFAEVLLEREPPWADVTADMQDLKYLGKHFHAAQLDHEQVADRGSNPKGKEAFAVTAALAVYHEEVTSDRETHALVDLPPHIDRIDAILRLRGAGEPITRDALKSAEKEMVALEFSKRQLGLILDWLAGTVNFVREGLSQAK